MPAIVNFNDISDITVLNNRISSAFGNDGADFWKKFFVCEERHPEEKIVYLFTKSQLKALHRWWDKKIVLSNETARRKLQWSAQIFFNEPVKKKKKCLYTHFDYRACYIERNKGGDPEIIETFRFFSSPPDAHKEGWFDFFDKKFIDALSEDITTWGDNPRKIIVDLELIGKSIGRKIIPTKENRWLHYLGNKIDKDAECIAYCAEIDCKCPLVAATFGTAH